MVSFRSMSCSSNSALRTILRMRAMTSLARWSSRLMSARISATSCSLGGSALISISAAPALLWIAPNGWLSSWAIDADSSPIDTRRFMCAISARRLRDSASAAWRRRRWASSVAISSACAATISQRDGNLPPILPPERPVRETDVAPFGQTPLIQRPALERTSIGDAAARYAEHGSVGRGRLAGQRVPDELPDQFATVLVDFHAAGRNTGAHVGREQTVDRRFRDTTEFAQHLARKVWSIVAVAKEREIQHDRIRGLVANPRAQLGGRPPGQEFDGGVTGHRRQYLSGPPFQFLVQWRHAGDDENSARIGLQAPGDCDRAAKVVAVHEAGSIGWDGHGLRSGIGKAVEHEARAWPQPLAVTHEEIERRPRDRHHHVDGECVVLLGQQRKLLRLQVLLRESLRVERLGVQDDPPGGLLGEARARGAVDRQVRGKIRIEAVENHDPRFFPGRVAPARRRRSIPGSRSRRTQRLEAPASMP